MPELFANLLIVALFINWVAQMIVIYRLPESHFHQPTDRVLWFIVVIVLFPVGAIVFWLWNSGHTKRMRAEQAHRKRQAGIAERLATTREPSQES